jgi:hypothetical protein
MAPKFRDADLIDNRYRHRQSEGLAGPLDALYPIVYLDCIHVKVQDGSIRVKAVYLTIGIN